MDLFHFGFLWFGTVVISEISKNMIFFWNFIDFSKVWKPLNKVPKHIKTIFNMFPIHYSHSMSVRYWCLHVSVYSLSMFPCTHVWVCVYIHSIPSLLRCNLHSTKNWRVCKRWLLLLLLLPFNFVHFLFLFLSFLMWYSSFLVCFLDFGCCCCLKHD